MRLHVIFGLTLIVKTFEDEVERKLNYICEWENVRRKVVINERMMTDCENNFGGEKDRL